MFNKFVSVIILFRVFFSQNKHTERLYYSGLLVASSLFLFSRENMSGIPWIISIYRLSSLPGIYDATQACEFPHQVTWQRGQSVWDEIQSLSLWWKKDKKLWTTTPHPRCQFIVNVLNGSLRASPFQKRLPHLRQRFREFLLLNVATLYQPRYVRNIRYKRTFRRSFAVDYVR